MKQTTNIQVFAKPENQAKDNRHKIRKLSVYKNFNPLEYKVFVIHKLI